MNDGSASGAAEAIGATGPVDVPHARGGTDRLLTRSLSESGS